MEVRFLDVQTVSAEQLALWESWLAPEKRQRLERMDSQKRLQSLCADALARQILAEMLHVAPQEIAFTYTENGKPLVNGAYFSISHSGDLVGCAVAEYPVGLDLEQIRHIITIYMAVLKEEILPRCSAAVSIFRSIRM